MEFWARAIQNKSVLVLPELCSLYTTLERVDQYKELSHWLKGNALEEGWLIFKKGLPSHFVKTNGNKEYLKVDPPLAVMGYNVLTSRHDGDETKLSMYEEELYTSGKFRYWAHRKSNIAKAVTKADVIGLCEATPHMIEYVLSKNSGHGLVAFREKEHNYDGSAILVNNSRCKVLKTMSSVLQKGFAQVFLACLVQDKITKTHFWIVVLHLKSDGSQEHGSMEDRRVQEAHAALARINSLTPKEPVVIVGDMNSDRFMYPYFEERGITHVMDVFDDFKSVLPLQPTYNHWNEAAFDHILVRDGTAVDTHVPQSHNVAPNALQGSDHLPVYADLVFY